MCHTEAEANMQGFSCYASGKSATMKARKAKGVNLFKLAGYCVTLLVLLAVVY